MLVFIVKVEFPAGAGGGRKYFRFAIRAESEAVALVAVSNKLGFNSSMVSSEGEAERQEEYISLKAEAPRLIYSPAN